MKIIRSALFNIPYAMQQNLVELKKFPP